MKKFWVLPLLLLGVAGCGDDNTEPVQPVDPPVEKQTVICSLTAPSSGAEIDLKEGGFEISGTALVDTGTIETVELKVGEELIEQVQSVPFNYNYTFPEDQQPGPLTITLFVTGNLDGQDTKSVTVTLISHKEPEPDQTVQATLTVPAEGIEWISDAPLNIAGEAEVNVGEIQNVTLTVGDLQIDEVSTVPFTYNFTAPEGLAEGELTITLKVTGDRGAEATESVTITHKKPAETPPTPPIPTPEEGEMVDARDGKIYRTVLLGTQTWMAENLAYLPEVYPAEAAADADTEKRYFVLNYQGNDVAAAKSTEEYATYGVLYNWFAANDTSDKEGSDAVPSGVRGICPEGWHLPSQQEWQLMEAWVAEQIEPVTGNYWVDDWGDPHYDSDLKNVWSALAAKDVWGESLGTDTYPDLANGGRDTFGFTALPAGFCWQTGSFDWRDSSTGFWSTEYQAYGGGCVELNNLQYHIAYTKSGYSPLRGYSVRCVKD